MRLTELRPADMGILIYITSTVKEISAKILDISVVENILQIFICAQPL